MWVRLFGAVVLAAALAGCGAAPPSASPSSATPKSVTRIQVGLATGIPGDSLVYIALDQGYFTSESLDVEPVASLPGGPQMAAALVGGSLKFTMLSALTYLDAVANGAEVQALFPIEQGVPQFLVLAPELARKSGVTSSSSGDQVARALKGQRVGVVSIGGVTDIALRVFVKAHGLIPESDLQILTVGGATGLAAALANHQIDAFISPASGTPAGTPDPPITWLVGNDPSLQGAMFSLMIAARSTLQQEAPMVTRFVRALFKASKFQQATPQAAHDITSKGLKSAGDAFDEAWTAELAVTKAGLVPTQSNYDKTIQVYEASGKSAPKLSLDQAFALHFLTDAQKSVSLSTRLASSMRSTSLVSPLGVIQIEPASSVIVRRCSGAMHSWPRTSYQDSGRPHADSSS